MAAMNLAGWIGLGSLLLVAAASADEDPLAAADKAYQEKRYREAHELALRAATAARSPGEDEKKHAQRVVQAWRLAGTSSCLQKERSGALQATLHLKKEDIQFLRFVCEKNGVAITDEDVEVWASPAAPEAVAAQEAYDAGKYADAKKMALLATAGDPKLGVGWRLLAAASCWTKDKATAQRASEHLQPIDQEAIRAICARTLGAQLKNPRILR